MIKRFATGAAVALAVVLAAGAAEAAGRSVNVTGPYGGSRYASGSCAGGSCSWSRGGTTRYGDSWNRQGQASCNGAGTCSVNRGGTGIYGNSWSRSRTVTRY
jgi:hypothetical protein